MAANIPIYQPGIGVLYCHPNRLRHNITEAATLVSIETIDGDGVLRLPHLFDENNKPLEVQLLMENNDDDDDSDDDSDDDKGKDDDGRVRTTLGQIHHNNELWCELVPFAE